jgi:prepilin-type N-terminal cleavage/methylation domain-containing protein
MDCKITSTISTSRCRRAFTLVEVLVAAGIASILMVAILSLAFFSARSFAALTNYVDLDNLSRNALDHMLKEIRQADRLTYYSATMISFQHTHPVTHAAYTVSYVYHSSDRTLSRVQGTNRRVLLRECDPPTLARPLFSIFQRNPLPGTWDQYPTADVDTCKLVQLNWKCSRSILGAQANTESVQSAKVVIRKK